MLEITDLHKSFDGKEILHGVTLNVKDGEIFGFIGQNGAGKTTTIRSAVGILDFEQGLFDFIDTKYPQIPESIKETKELSEDTEKLLVSAIEEFKKTFNC